MGVLKLIKKIFRKDKEFSLLGDPELADIKLLNKREIFKKIRKAISKHYHTANIYVYESDIQSACKALRIKGELFYLSKDISLAVNDNELDCLISSTNKTITNDQLDKLNWIFKKLKKCKVINSVVISSWFNEHIDHHCTLDTLEKLFKAHYRNLLNHEIRIITPDQSLINNYWQQMVDIKPRFVIKGDIKSQLENYYQELGHDQTNKLIKSKKIKEYSSKWFNEIASIVAITNANSTSINQINSLCKYYKITNIFCFDNYQLIESSYQRSIFNKLGILILSLSLIFFCIFMRNVVVLKQQDLLQKSVLSWDVNSVKQLENLYNKRVDNYRNKLSLAFLYPKESLYPRLNRQFVDVFNALILQNKYDNKLSSKSLFIYVTLLATKHHNIKFFINKNLDNWAYALGISSNTLEIILNTKIDNPSHIVKIDASDINQLINYLRNNNSDQLIWVKKFLSDNKQNLNLRTLAQLLQDYQHQNIINQLLSKLFTDNVINLDTLDKTDQDILKEIDKKDLRHIKEIKHSKLLANIEKLLNEIKLNNNANFFEVIDGLQANGQIIENYLKTSYLSTNSRKFVNTLVQQSLINTVIEISLHNKHSFMPLLDNDYYQLTLVHSNLNRQDIKTASAYTKATISKQIQPKLAIYSSLIQKYNILGVKVDALEQLKKSILKEYIYQYIQTYEKLFVKIWPTKVDTEELSLFLTDISSDQSPFSNTLDYIQTNTNLGNENKKFKSFKEISQQFKPLNDFLKSKEFEYYRNSLANISELLDDNKLENYVQLYKVLNQEKVSNSKLSIAIAGISSVQNQVKLNPQLKEYLLSPMQRIKEYLLINIAHLTQNKWNKDIEPELLQLNQSYPININSHLMISDQRLVDLIGIHGDLYLSMYDLLKPFIKDKFNNIKLDPNLPKQIKVIINPLFKQFSYIKLWQNTLWDKNGQPKPIKLEIKAQAFSNDSANIAISFINIGKRKVQGLNTNENASISIDYQWYLKPTITIGYLSNQNQVYQQSFDGQWALIKALNASNSNKNIYNWNIKDDIGHPYKIAFYIQNQLLNSFQGQGDK